MAYVRTDSAIDFNQIEFGFFRDVLSATPDLGINLNFAPWGIPDYTAQDRVTYVVEQSFNFQFSWTIFGTGIVLDEDGRPIGGRITGIAPQETDLQTGGNDFGDNVIVGFDISAADFADAVDTRRTTDDRAILSAILSGDDLFDLSHRSDNAFGGTGDDTINGGRGSDTLAGDAGKDSLDGGKGNDSLLGGSDRDMLVGGKGSDTLVGGSGNDRLIGGDDADTFVFGAADGRDSITDFDPVADIIALNGASGALAPVVSDVVGGAQVVWGTTTITVLGISAADLDSGNLLFPLA